MAQLIERLREILRYHRAQPVPNAPPFIEGMIDLRGEVLPILDLRKRFQVPDTVTPQTRILVTWVHQYPMGFVVDEARDFIRVTLEQIQPVPPMPPTLLADFIVGAVLHEGQVLYLPDFDVLLAPAERTAWVDFQTSVQAKPSATA